MTCAIGTDLDRAARLLREGGLVAFPTETVYGLGADALSAIAVARVFEAKERPRFDPLIVHVPDSSQLALLVTEVPEPARVLIERFWPGPLTLVLPKTRRVPDLVTSGLPTVAVRCPDHPLARELLARAGVPAAAPSANLFGRLSPTEATHVVEQLAERIDYILDGGSCRIGVESTVLDASRAPAVLLRPGGLPVEEIEAVIGPVALAGEPHEAFEQPQASPGRLRHHYAPRTPLVLEAGPPAGTRRTEFHSARTSRGRSGTPSYGLLTFTPPSDAELFAVVEVLSPTGDLREAAAGFFAALRRLDEQRLDLIVARPFPAQGLGRALNDRLRRAQTH